jgi:hypothetical protein
MISRKFRQHAAIREKLLKQRSPEKVVQAEKFNRKESSKKHQIKERVRAQSPVREEPTEMFEFPQADIDALNKIKCKRGYSPIIHRVKFNPRDHNKTHGSPTKRLAEIEKLLQETNNQIVVTYKEPLPRFRSAKNTPIKDYEHNLLYQQAKINLQKAKEMKQRVRQEVERSLEMAEIAQKEEEVTKIDTVMKEDSESEDEVREVPESR